MPYLEHTLPPEVDRPAEFATSPCETGQPFLIDCADIDVDASNLDGRFAHIDEEFPEQSIQLEKRGSTSHVTSTGAWTKKEEFQGNFWTKQTIFKNSAAAKLRTIGRPDIAAELEHCHSEITYARCGGCRTVSKFLNRCDRFYCAECTPKLVRERKESVEWWSKEIAQPKHVILTVRNVGRLTKKFVKAVKKMFGKLRRMAFCKNWRGGFYSLEVTNKDKGWHLHIHALVDANYIHGGQLAIAWAKATKKLGYIVKVKDCRRTEYLKEVTKYAVKGSMLSAWTGQQILDYILAFDGVKQFGVFGSLHGKRTEFREWLKEIRGCYAKCKCGCDNVQFYNQNEWDALEIKLSEQIASVPKPVKNNTFEFGFVRQIDVLAAVF